MSQEFVRKIEPKISNNERLKGEKESEPEKESVLTTALLYLDAYGNDTKAEISEKDRDSIVEVKEKIRSGKVPEEIFYWLNRPSPIEKELIETIENLKKGKGTKRELCANENQLHIYVNSRFKLIGQIRKLLEKKDI